MHSGLKNIHFNIRESIFLKIRIHFNSFPELQKRATKFISTLFVLWVYYKEKKTADKVGGGGGRPL